MRRRLAFLAVAVLGTALGCNFIFAKGRVSEMVPGGNVGSGELECWLTFEVKSLPTGADPKDVRIVFSSAALEQSASFDWDFIASRDLVSLGMMQGHAFDTATDPSKPPPLGHPIKVKYPLRAKRRIEADGQIWLEARLMLGGVEHGSMKRTIDHMYKREGSPWPL